MSEPLITNKRTLAINSIANIKNSNKQYYVSILYCPILPPAMVESLSLLTLWKRHAFNIKLIPPYGTLWGMCPLKYIANNMWSRICSSSASFPFNAPKPILLLQRSFNYKALYFVVAHCCHLHGLCSTMLCRNSKFSLVFMVFFSLLPKLVKWMQLSFRL